MTKRFLSLMITLVMVVGLLGIMSETITSFASDNSYYSSVIEQYKKALKNNLYTDTINWVSSVGKYINSELISASRTYKNYGNQYSDENFYIYYTLSDLNNDGTKELFIGAGKNKNSVRLYDVFYYNGYSPTHLFDLTFGYRANLIVYKDNTFAVSGSSGYNTSSISYYHLLRNSYIPVFIEEYGMDQGSCYHISNKWIKKTITNQKYTTVSNKLYNNTKKFSWTKITQKTKLKTHSVTAVNKAKKAMKQAKIKKLTAKAKGKKITVSWKKIKKATGYQVKLATNQKFTKNKKTVNVKKNKVILKKLKSKKKYFVKVRAYKTVNGNTSYGKWSKVVKKKVK